MDPSTSRTDPRVLRTRRLLRDAFVELLEEMEIGKISVNRITERATINRVTFYLHYRDIPDMLEKMADEMMENIRLIVTQTPENHNCREEVDSSMMVNLLEHIAEHAKFYKVVLATRQTSIFMERMFKLLTDAIASRMEKIQSESYIAMAGVQMDIAVRYFSAALIGTVIEWLRNDMPYTPHFLAKQFSLLSPSAGKKCSH